MLPVQKIFIALVLLVGAFLWGRTSIPTVTPPEYVAINECPTGMGKINPTGVIECSPGSNRLNDNCKPMSLPTKTSVSNTATVEYPSTQIHFGKEELCTVGGWDAPICDEHNYTICQNITDRKVQTYDCYTGESIGKPRDFSDDVCNIQWSDGTAEVPCDSGLSAELITN